MSIEEIKRKMLDYRDYFGQALINSSDIEGCENITQLAEILDYHEEFIEIQCNDAQSSVNRFKRNLGLYDYE